MKTRLLISLACFAGLCVSSASAQPSLDPRTLTADLPFAMAPVALPQIPARVCSIADHGARGDGATLNTEAIALRRVEIAAEAGPALAISNSRNVKVEGGAAAPGTGEIGRAHV